MKSTYMIVYYLYSFFDRCTHGMFFSYFPSICAIWLCITLC